MVCLATTPPTESALPKTHWSPDDLAYQILQEAYYTDMSRSTIRRILNEAELRPHKSRYWLTARRCPLGAVSQMHTFRDIGGQS